MLSRQTCDCPPLRDCPSSITVSFDSASYQVTAEGPFDNGRTWRYKVRRLAGPDLSHFDVQFCTAATVGEWRIYSYDPVLDRCTGLLASGTGPARNFAVLLWGDPSSVCFAAIPNIKFDNLSDFEAITENFCFQFTLGQCYQTACICVDLKAGRNDGCGCITGPSPECEPCQPARGFRL